MSEQKYQRTVKGTTGAPEKRLLFRRMKRKTVRLKKGDKGWFPIITTENFKKLCNLDNASFGKYTFTVDLNRSTPETIYFEVLMPSEKSIKRKDYSETFVIFPKRKEIERVGKNLY